MYHILRLSRRNVGVHNVRVMGGGILDGVHSQKCCSLRSWSKTCTHKELNREGVLLAALAGLQKEGLRDTNKLSKKFENGRFGEQQPRSFLFIFY